MKQNCLFEGIMHTFVISALGRFLSGQWVKFQNGLKSTLEGESKRT